MNKASGAGSSRREFIRNSGAVMAAAATFNVASSARAAAGDSATEVLKVGLIGCGGRGTGAVREALLADPNTKLVALGDTFSDRLDECLTKLKSAGSGIEAQIAVDDDHKFTGFDNYLGVIAACDVVVLATPPAFRPAHLKAAIEKVNQVKTGTDIEAIKAAITSLDNAADAMAKHLYSKGGGAETTPGTAAADKKDDVMDAEYEVK